MSTSTRTPKRKLIGNLGILFEHNYGDGLCIITDNDRYFLSKELYEIYINSDSESLTVAPFELGIRYAGITYEIEIKDIKRIGYRPDSYDVWEEIDFNLKFRKEV